MTLPNSNTILSKLFTGVTSDNNGDFYCLNYLYSLTTKVFVITRVFITAEIF